MSDWLDELLASWREDGVKLNEGATPERLQRFERRHGVRLGDDFKALYLRADGMPDLGCDGHHLSLWPLDQISREGFDQSDGKLFEFADYLILSHCYAVPRDATEGDPVSVSGQGYTAVAPSFEEFWRKVLHNPTAVQLAPPDAPLGA